MIRRCRSFETNEIFETVQWTGDNLQEVFQFMGHHPFCEGWPWREYEKFVQEKGLRLYLSANSYIAPEKGDFILKNSMGYIQGCEQDFFKRSYQIFPKWEDLLREIPQLPQRQDSLLDQLKDLHTIANRFGLYDAADALKRYYSS